MLYLWIKSIHIIAAICWFAGLFYLPRLFDYHAMSEDKVSHERFCTMLRKMYRGIMRPSMVLTIVFGLALIKLNPAWFATGAWLHIKLALVALLVGYQFLCGARIKEFAEGKNTKSHVFYRWFNEVPVLFLIAIVILVTVKPI